MLLAKKSSVRGCHTEPGASGVHSRGGEVNTRVHLPPVPVSVLYGNTHNIEKKCFYGVPPLFLWCFWGKYKIFLFSKYEVMLMYGSVHTIYALPYILIVLAKCSLILGRLFFNLNTDR